ncbi:uncharacterized protein LOC133305770, partial [Gastrolobium bilobum]|uniref:uncharacterized protein LOC133305770 n=1 Tax=Gastrolobium bilobum TaxID=150636 RepID=UPI002AB1843F
MGGKCPHRHVKKRRYSHKTARRTKFLYKGDDMVYAQLNQLDEDKSTLPVDEDLPGMGQYYCLHCDRYFSNVAVRDEHFKTKRHKKRYDGFAFADILPAPTPFIFYPSQLFLHLHIGEY